MKQKVLETIRKHNLIENNMHIVVGLSGGPDSVCLFDILRHIPTEDGMNLTLHAVHVNHKFRPGAAEADQQYVEELCKKTGVDCQSFEIDCNELAVKEGLTSEEAGRKARYEAFSKVAQAIHKTGVPKEKIVIALAHNANDQCETIFFRIMRGTGTDGLAGIPYKRFDENGFAIVRPIMDLRRAEIEKYCKDANLSPRIDHTNDENIYARNKIRNMLIPFIEENFNENIIDTVNRMGKIAASDRDFIAKEAHKAYADAAADNSCNPNPPLDCEILKDLHDSIRFRVYDIALEKLGMMQGLTYAQSEAIDSILESKSPSAVCELSDGYIARRQYDMLVFDRQMTYGYSNAVNWRLRTLTPNEFVIYKEENKGKIFGAFQGVEEKDLMLRTRKAGDRIKLGNGSKKLQDYFVDQKVPKFYRDEVLLLTKGSNVLWIIPSENNKGRFSAEYRVDEKVNSSIVVLEGCE